MDITPLTPGDRQIVESYGDGRFCVSGVVHEGSVLVLPDRTLAWSVGHIDDLTLDSLEPAFATAAEVDVLLLGCGATTQLIPRDLRDAVRGRGLVLEPMDTGAAARTYNVLVAEERRVAAALIAVP